MADTKGKKGKSKKNKSEGKGSKEEKAQDEKNNPANGDEKKSKSKKGNRQKEIADTLSILPVESNGTDNMLSDFTETEKQTEPGGTRRPLTWHPDEVKCSQLCLNCLQINYNWPPRPRPFTPPDKDPNLIYPGDVDPDFKPVRGDILMVHPRGLGLDTKLSPEELWWKSKRIGGGFCVSYDGDKKFKFEVGDLVLRIGSYVNGDIDVAVGDEEKPPEEGEKKSKKGKKPSKSKKLADPPRRDPVTYKPYDKVELYRCSDFEILKEDAPLQINELEEELRRVFENNTTYDFSMEKKVIPDGGVNSRRDSWKDRKLAGNELTNQLTDLKELHQECIGDQVIHRVNSSEVKFREPLLNTKAKEESNSRIANMAQNFVESRDLDIYQSSQRDLDSPKVGATTEAPKEKQPKVKLIWTYLGSQSKLPKSEDIAPLTDSKCPGLGCFYHPYFNLGKHCKKAEHNHAPNLGEILIPEGVWLKNFDHRKNNWRSMVEWYIPLGPPTLSAQDDEAGPPSGGKDKEGLNPDIDKGKRESVHKKEEKSKDKEGEGKSKSGLRKGKDLKRNHEDLDSSKSDVAFVQSDAGKKHKAGGKGKERVEETEPPQTTAGKERVEATEPPQTTADKAVQVPHDLEEVLKEDIASQIVPSNLRKEHTLGTILIRPFVGRKFTDELTPVEEWKWPRKYPVWGSVEMYMVERAIGTEDLDWVFWGKSERICDATHPLPAIGAKLKFLHPNDANVEVPGGGKDQGEDPLLLTREEDKELLTGKSSEGGQVKPGKEDGGKKKKKKKKRHEVK